MLGIKAPSMAPSWFESTKVGGAIVVPDKSDNRRSKVLAQHFSGLGVNQELTKSVV